MRVKINGISLNYRLTGQGKTLVLTHGLGGSLAAWQDLAPEMSKHYQVLTWDVRGFGESDKPEEEYSPQIFSQDLHGLLEVLSIEKVYLLGHSMGGVIAQRFTLDYPRQVDALILVATSSEVGPRATEAWAERTRLVEEQGMKGLTQFTHRLYAPGFGEAHPQVVDRRVEELLKNDPKAYIRATRAISKYNYTPELGGISCPTLILQGDKDIVTPPGGSVIMSRHIPGSRLKIYENCGHGIPGEKPEEFRDDLLSFLRDHG